MKTEDIVEAINLELEDRRRQLQIESKGHFILQRNVEIDPSFKIYKTYSIKLWYFKNKKEQFLVLSDCITDRVIGDDDEKIIRALNISFLSKFFKLYNSEKWINIVKYGIPES